jgi:AcrR family transcriptional regulator
VNLRELSRELGYAHTNAYNYFGGLEDLLGRALVAALERQYEAARRALDGAGADPRRRMSRLVASQVDFALAHPGWYRFVWFEPLAAPPPPRAVEIMLAAGEELARTFGALSRGALAPAAARRAAEDFHTWLHGALAKALFARVRSADPARVRRSLEAGARRMLRALVPRAGRSPS